MLQNGKAHLGELPCPATGLIEKKKLDENPAINFLWSYIYVFLVLNCRAS